jgi:hypothetical protein
MESSNVSYGKYYAIQILIVKLLNFIKISAQIMNNFSKAWPMKNSLIYAKYKGTKVYH